MWPALLSWKGKRLGEWLTSAVIEGNVLLLIFYIQKPVTWLSHLKSGVKSSSLIWYLTQVTITLFTQEGLLSLCCLKPLKIYLLLFGNLEARNFSNHRNVWISGFSFSFLAHLSFPRVLFTSPQPLDETSSSEYTLLTFCFSIFPYNYKY